MKAAPRIMNFVWGLALRRILANTIDLALILFFAATTSFAILKFVLRQTYGPPVSLPSGQLSAFDGWIISMLYAFSLPAAIAGFFIIGSVYILAFERSNLKATPGKLALDLRVSNTNSNERSLWRILLRNLLKLLFAGVAWITVLNFGQPIWKHLAPPDPQVLLVDPWKLVWFMKGWAVLLLFLYLSIGLGEKRRALHDVLSGMRVVRRFDLVSGNPAR